MEKKYMLVLDEGTTGLRSLVVDKQFDIVSQSYEKVTSFYPGPQDVEQDPNEIFEKQVKSMRDAVAAAGISPEEIAGIGISVQRGTFCFWDKVTGEPLHNFLVWLDTRGVRSMDFFAEGSDFAKKYPELAASTRTSGGSNYNKHVTLMRENPELAERIKQDNVAYGGIDAWLVYKLTGGKVFAACKSHMGTLPLYSRLPGDYLYDSLADIGIRADMLPEVLDDSAFYGNLDKDILGVEIPILSCVADQQSALFSEGCQEPGTAKCTLGTGAFLDINIGDKPTPVPGMNIDWAWKIGDVQTFMAEGAIFTCGACLEWAKTNLGIIDDFGTMEAVANSVPDNGGVYFVPAINGMSGLPFNNDAGRASFMGISAASTRAHFVRACLEALAYSISYVFKNTTEASDNLDIKAINIDGGVSRSAIICQLIADITGATVIRQKSGEASALGAGELAGLQVGWLTIDDVAKRVVADKVYTPNPDNTTVMAQYKYWLKAAERSKDWL